MLLLHGEWSALGSRIGGVHWSFAPGGRALLWVGLPVVALASAFCYYRTSEGLRLRTRIALAGLRLLAFVAMLIMAAGTVLNVSVMKTRNPEMLVLIDDSPSMELPDSDGGQTRMALAKDALAHGLLDMLQKHYAVRIDRTSGLEANDSWLNSSATVPTLPQDLGKAVIQQASRFTDRPVSDILLISDGVQPEGAADLARVADEVQAPIGALTFGDGENIRDVNVEDVSVPPYVYQNDRALISAQIRSLGIEGDAALQLVLVQNGIEKPVASSKIALKPGAAPTVARVEFQAPEPGIQHYILRIAPMPGELTDKNNSIAFNLDVRPEKIRVLFVEGEPSWEYRYAKEVLEADPAIDFHGIVRLGDQEWFYQGPAARPDGKPVLKNPKNGFPDSQDELNYFDVLILGDLERKVFEQGGRFALVDAFVRQHGGGLATLGGLKVYGAGNYEDTVISRMVPFEIAHEKKLQLVNRFNVQVTTQGLMHPLMQIEFDPEKNEKAWSGLPWVEGGNAIAGVKAGATLLMAHPTQRTRNGSRPISAAWQYGRGHVFSTALDGTWHWRLARKTDIDYHRRYWSLIARWLANDPRSAKSVGSIVCDDAVLETGRPATFSVFVRDPDGNPLLDATADFAIATPSGERIVARSVSDPATPGRYAVAFAPRASGLHKVSVEIATRSDQPQKREATWNVAESREEFKHVRPDAKALAALAQKRGGTAALLRDWKSLKLPERPATVVAQPLVLNLWQSYGLPFILVLCLSLEWLFRKRRGLA